MPFFAIAAIVIAIIRALQRKGGGTVTSRIVFGRQILWFLFALGVAISMLVECVVVIGSIFVPAPLPIVIGVVGFPVVVFAAFAAFAPWKILARIAQRGRYKLAYYTSHFILHGQATAEPYAAASLVGCVALARRGLPERSELDWLHSRFDKETRALGFFGVTFGLLEALEGNLARREGREQEAHDHRERARVLFGTTTYLSVAAMPSHLREIASDYLVLDSIRRGEWGATESLKPKDLSPLALAIKDWVRARLLQRQDLPPSKKYKKKPPPPIVAKLDEREEQPRITTDDDAFAMMSRDYVALVKGERPSPRAVLNLLTALDAFFDPRSPKHRLPPEIATSDEAADAIAESIADAVALALRERGAPVFALRFHGSVSARVYQKLESGAANDLTIALKGLRERAERRLRGPLKDEWLEVSRVRGLYRRIELTLGTEAAGAFAGQMFYDYGRFGVMLSETFPRRRPLAHAVFHCMYDEAVKLGNHEAGRREAKNMGVTSLVD